MSKRLRKARLIARLAAQYGGPTVGTMLLLQEALTRPGVAWCSEGDLIRRLRVLPGVERRTAPEVRQGLAALFDEGWMTVRANRVDTAHTLCSQCAPAMR